MHGHLSVRSVHCLLNTVAANNQLRWMFDCCRIPGPQRLDWSISYAKESDLGDSGHIVVFRNNRVWKVEIAKDGRLLSTHDIQMYATHPNFTTVHRS